MAKVLRALVAVLSLLFAAAPPAWAAAALTPTPALTEATAPEVAAWFAPSAKGQTRVVHLWASWCRPCAAELPRLLAALRSRRDRVDVVFLSLDGEASASKAAALLRKNGGVPGVSVRANARALAAIRAFDPAWDGSLPTTFVVSPEGHLAVAQRGITELEPLLSELDRSDAVSTTHTASKE